MPALRPMPAAVLSAAVLALPALAALLMTAPTGATAAERPARSRLCPDDLPEGVRLPPSPGCDAAASPDRSSARSPAKSRGDGFIDLGDGTSVRIGGRAGAEFGGRR